MAKKMDTNTRHPPEAGHVASHYPLPMVIDFERYAELLEGADPNDPDVQKLLETLFQIQVQIADISWGLSPTQIACGQTAESEAVSTVSCDLVLQSSHETLTSQFTENVCKPEPDGGPA